MFQSSKILCLLRIQTKYATRSLSTVSRTAIQEKRAKLFSEERKRQTDNVGRIESINVLYKSSSEDVQLSMKKHLSTPLDCARHIKEGLTKLTAVALVNNQVWDVHTPLTSDCELRLITLLNPEVPAANMAFWRTCSFILGATVESSFKDDVQVFPHSFPYPQINSGSFVHDIFLNVSKWEPTPAEMRALSAEFIKLVRKEFEFERLDVSEEFACRLFEDNPLKLEQIPSVAKDNNGIVTLYKIGNYIDISKGPLIANTHAIGRVTVAAMHKSPIESVPNLYRFQGVALPKGIMLNHFTYSLLEARAKNFNDTVWIPHSVVESTDNGRIESVAAAN